MAAGEHATDEDDELRAVSVDEPALDRHEPRLEQDEQRERDLDGGPIPAELLLDVGDEERPSVLKIRDHHHAADADR